VDYSLGLKITTGFAMTNGMLLYGRRWFPHNTR